MLATQLGSCPVIAWRGFRQLPTQPLEGARIAETFDSSAKRLEFAEVVTAFLIGSRQVF